MGVPSPTSNPAAWDALTLGKHVFPKNSQATVKIKRTQKVEKKEPKDTSGATTTVKGASVADVTITVKIGKLETFDDDWAALQEILEDIDPAPGKTSEPCAIAHPMAEMRQVFDIVIEGIEGPNPKGDPGGEWELTISASEWRPAKTQPAKTPNASQAVNYTTANQAAGKEGPPPPQNAGPPPPGPGDP